MDCYVIVKELQRNWKEDCIKVEETGDVLFMNLHKTEVMLEKKEEDFNL